MQAGTVQLVLQPLFFLLQSRYRVFLRAEAVIAGRLHSSCWALAVCQQVLLCFL